MFTLGVISTLLMALAVISVKNLAIGVMLLIVAVSQVRKYEVPQTYEKTDFLVGLKVMPKQKLVVRFQLLLKLVSIKPCINQKCLTFTFC